MPKVSPEELHHLEQEKNLRVLQLEMANALLDAGAISFDFKEGFQFVSGIRSPIYIDSRTVFYKEETRQQATQVLSHYLTLHADTLPYDIIAGTAVGGILPGLLLAEKQGDSFVYVRKAVKDHGKQNRIEGGDVKGKRVLLIEDLVTLGTSSIPAIDALKSAGATVAGCVSLASYGFDRAYERFRETNVELHSIVSVPLIVAAAHARGLITALERDNVLEWLALQNSHN